MPTPSCPSAPTVPEALVPPQHSLGLQQWGTGVGPYHSQGTELGTPGGRGRSVPNQNCQKIIIGAERRQSLFPPPQSG